MITLLEYRWDALAAAAACLLLRCAARSCPVSAASALCALAPVSRLGVGAGRAALHEAHCTATAAECPAADRPLSPANGSIP